MKLILFAILLAGSSQGFVLNVDETKFHLVKSYLCRYGYMNENVCKQHADDSLKFMQYNARDMYRGLIIFQTMFNITRTGKIDEETIMKMAKPRCGNKDFDMQFSSSRFLNLKKNDFSILRRGLNKLSYSIRKYNSYLNRYSRSLTNEIVEEIVDKAFQIWVKNVSGNIKVTRLTEEDMDFEKSNITIYFAEGNHGDSLLFDGIDGELAHSCSLSNTNSPYRGHIHLDDSENWSKGNRLLSVLLHEIGHIFGLDHSSNTQSIMSPVFSFSENILQDDVRNLKMILGIDIESNTTKTAKTTTTTTPRTTVTTTSTTTAKSTTRPVVKLATTEATIQSTEVNNERLNEVIEENSLNNLINIDSEEISQVLNATSDEINGLEYSNEYNLNEDSDDDLNEQEDDYEELMHLIESNNKTNVSKQATKTHSDSTEVAPEFVDDTNVELGISDLETGEASDISTTSKPPINTPGFVDNSYYIGQPQPPVKNNYWNNNYKNQYVYQKNYENNRKEETVNRPSSDNVPAFVYNKNQKTAAPPNNYNYNINSNVNSYVVPNTHNTFAMNQNLQQQQKSYESEYAKKIDPIVFESNNGDKKKSAPADLCNDPYIDAITRTEWGNAFIFKGDNVYHVRGLTKWRLFDYEGWPKRINDLFPRLPTSIDSAYYFGENYFFTKNDLIWKYRSVASYPPRYEMVDGYPMLIRDEYPDIPFRSIDSAFAAGASIFFFKDYEFWQSDWSTNVTGRMPIKVNAALDWRNPRIDSSLSEPLAYLISNTSMYKFNYWSIPLSHESADIRYFLFDCVQANAPSSSYKQLPESPTFLGPSYKQAFLINDIYNRPPVATDTKWYKHRRSAHQTSN